jgi:hypothetical protein
VDTVLHLSLAMRVGGLFVLAICAFGCVVASEEFDSELGPDGGGEHCEDCISEDGALQSSSKRQLFANPRFTAGLSVLDPLTKQPIYAIRATGTPDPEWRLSQHWSYNGSLNDAGHQNGYHEWANGMKRVALADPGAPYDLRLRINTRREYGDRCKTFEGPYNAQNRKWAHLEVANVATIRNSPALSTLSALRFGVGAKLSAARMFNDLDANCDSTKHPAHFTAVIALASTSGEFVNLTLPMYDNRKQFVPAAIFEDKATGKLIYRLEQRAGSSTSMHSGAHVDFAVDLLPHARKAIKAAHDRGYVASTALSQWRVNRVSMGWEVPGLANMEMSIRGLRLNAIE